MKKENAIIAIIAVGVVGFVGGRMSAKPAQAPVVAAAAVDPAAVKADGPAAAAPAAVAGMKNPVVGPATAKITLIEVSDFQCPFCSRAATTVDQLRKEYKDQLRLIFVNQPLPFHDRARPAALAGAAANRQGKFFELYDKMFAGQRELTDDNLRKWAKESGIDMVKFEADLKDPSLVKEIDRDVAIANALGVRGTPGFFINGVNLSGAQPVEAFKKVIDEQIVKANDELGKGTKAEEVADKLTRANNPSLADNMIKWVMKGGDAPAEAAGAAGGGDKPPPPKRQEDDKTVWKVLLRGDEPTKGPADALITIVEYTDFQCPFCSKARLALDEVEVAYKDKVRIVFKNLPLEFHKNAPGAAEAAQCGKDQGKFWEMEKQLFSNQQALEPEKLAEHAKTVGLDAAKFEKCMKDHKFKEYVEKDAASAEKISATGTPAFFIMGRKLNGAKPFEEFKRVIDEEVTKAEEAVKGGTAKKDLYAKAIGNGKVFEPPAALEAKVTEFDYVGSPWKGDKGAKVKIVQFKDFQCPFCVKINPTLAQVEKDLRGKVAIVFKHFPLSSQCNPKMTRDMHPAACTATYWSMAAEDQGKFWEFEEIVYNNYSQMMPAEGDLPARQAAQTENLKKYAKEVGMDVAKAEAYVKGEKYKPRLAKDLAEAEAAGVRGTPSLYINGRSYNAPMTPDKMKEIVLKVAEGKL